MPEFVYLSPPDVGEEESDAVWAAVQSGWVTTLGPNVDAFEAQMCSFLGVDNAVALSSGTAALHLALLGLGVRPGDEVLVQSLTFAATANAVVYCGASPVFIDSEMDTWNMDPDLLLAELKEMAGRGALPSAVVAVDIFGRCADYTALAETCSRYDVPLLEDAAEALGATFNGGAAGSFGQAATLSFNGNKIMTTGGGGMLLTQDDELAARARYLASQARQPVPHYEHTDVGFNYRLSNVLAALGQVQLRRLPEMIRRRRSIRQRYSQVVAGSEFAMHEDPAGHQSNAWLSTILCPDADEAARLLAALSAQHLEARHIWMPMHRQPVFDGHRARVNGVSDTLFARGVCLPSGSAMDHASVARVCDVLEEAARR